jgi:hypothetical protein
MLTDGTLAPEFDLPDQSGKRHTLGIIFHDAA